MSAGIAEVEMDQDFKVYENRLRRAAARQELRLVKARRIDRRAVDYGTYMLVDANGVVVAGERMDIRDVERYLTGAE